MYINGGSKINELSMDMSPRISTLKGSKFSHDDHVQNTGFSLTEFPALNTNSEPILRGSPSNGLHSAKDLISQSHSQSQSPLGNLSSLGMLNSGIYSYHTRPKPSNFVIQKEDFPALPMADTPRSSGLPSHLMESPRNGSQREADVFSQPNERDFGILGLSSSIPNSLTQRKTMSLRSYLAKGLDLDSIGLNMERNQSALKALKAPFLFSGTRLKQMPGDPVFRLPNVYLKSGDLFHRSLREKDEKMLSLKRQQIKKCTVGTLFFMFYCLPRDVLQVMAAQELYGRGWKLLKGQKIWLLSGTNPSASDLVGGPVSPNHFVTFDVKTWKKKLYSQRLQGSMAEMFLSIDQINTLLPLQTMSQS